MNELLSLTIENAKKNKEALLALLSGAGDVTLDLSTFDAIDLSGLQMFVAFAREANARKKKFSFIGDVRPEFSRALAISGLAPDGCTTAAEVEAAIKAVCP